MYSQYEVPLGRALIEEDLEGAKNAYIANIVTEIASGDAQAIGTQLVRIQREESKAECHSKMEKRKTRAESCSQFDNTLGSSVELDQLGILDTQIN